MYNSEGKTAGMNNGGGLCMLFFLALGISMYMSAREGWGVGTIEK